MSRVSDIERFENKIIVDQDGHWLWTACTTDNGYGFFRFRGSNKLAHRVAWCLFVGEVPEDLCVLHKNFCHTRHCVNPHHLYLGTEKDNARDSIELGTFRGAGEFQAKKTHCPAGHEYTSTNTYYEKNKIYRKCRECTLKRIGLSYLKQDAQIYAKKLAYNRALYAKRKKLQNSC